MKPDVWRPGIVSEEGFVENRGQRLIPLSTDSDLKMIDLVVKDPKEAYGGSLPLCNPWDWIRAEGQRTHTHTL